MLIRFRGVSDFGNDIYVDNINVLASAGVKEIENISSVSIYPNPASDAATINFSVAKSSSVLITLNNMLGEEIMKKELGIISSGENNYQLNLDGINNGLYFVSLKTASGSITKKVAVNK